MPNPDVTAELQKLELLMAGVDLSSRILVLAIFVSRARPFALPHGLEGSCYAPAPVGPGLDFEVLGLVVWHWKFFPEPTPRWPAWTTSGGGRDPGLCLC